MRSDRQWNVSASTSRQCHISSIPVSRLNSTVVYDVYTLQTKLLSIGWHHYGTQKHTKHYVKHEGDWNLITKYGNAQTLQCRIMKQADYRKCSKAWKQLCSDADRKHLIVKTLKLRRTVNRLHYMWKLTCRWTLCRFCCTLAWLVETMEQQTRMQLKCRSLIRWTRMRIWRYQFATRALYYSCQCVIAPHLHNICWKGQ